MLDEPLQAAKARVRRHITWLDWLDRGMAEYGMVLSEALDIQRQFQRRVSELDLGYLEMARRPVCSRFSTAAALIPTLDRLGYRKIGEGYCSDIFRRGEAPRVLKINRRADTNIDYLLWGHERGHREVPCIHAARIYPDRTYAVVMEYLPRTVEHDPASWRSFDALLNRVRRGKGRFARDLRRALPLQDWERFTEPPKNCMVRNDGSLVLTDCLPRADCFRVRLAYIRAELSLDAPDAGGPGVLNP